jgi:hypothetical protein
LQEIEVVLVRSREEVTERWEMDFEPYPFKWNRYVVDTELFEEREGERDGRRDRYVAKVETLDI